MFKIRDLQFFSMSASYAYYFLSCTFLPHPKWILCGARPLDDFVWELDRLAHWVGYMQVQSCQRYGWLEQTFKWMTVEHPILGRPSAWRMSPDSLFICGTHSISIQWGRLKRFTCRIGNFHVFVFHILSLYTRGRSTTWALRN